MGTPKVSVIVVNWNRAELLRRCLESLQVQTMRDFEVIVVDNGSADGSAEMVARSYPGVRLLCNASNTGFCAANNRGIRSARGEFVALINNDAQADPRWLEKMLEAIGRVPGAGMCAPKIYRGMAPGVLDSAGMGVFPDGTSRGLGNRRRDRGQFDRRTQALVPSGCAALYRRAAVENAGMFDEDFFAYCEDTDLGLRLRLEGWGCAFAPEAVVYHRYAPEGNCGLGRKIYLLERNHYLLAFKTFPAALLLLLPLFVLVRVTVQLLGTVLSAQGGRSRLCMVRAALSAYADLVRGFPSAWRKRCVVRRRRQTGDMVFLSWFFSYGAPLYSLYLKDE